MKNDTPINHTDVDTILEEFYDKVFEHAYRVGQEFPDDKQVPHDPCNAEDKIKLRAALLSLLLSQLPKKKEPPVFHYNPAGYDVSLHEVKAHNKALKDCRAVLTELFNPNAKDKR